MPNFMKKIIKKVYNTPKNTIKTILKRNFCNTYNKLKIYININILMLAKRKSF
jgi:hypothetical protein